MQLQNKRVTTEQLEANKALILAFAERAAREDLLDNAPFELKQRIIKLLIDKIVLNVEEKWFRLEGRLPRAYTFDCSIEGNPVGMGSEGRASSVLPAPATL